MNDNLEESPTISRKEIFESDRGEREEFGIDIILDNPMRLPITRDGFEAMLEIGASICAVAVDDQLRSVLCGYIHSIDRKTDTFTFQEWTSVIHKHYCNNLTWIINEELQAKAREERKKHELSLVGQPKVETNEEQAH